LSARRPTLHRLRAPRASAHHRARPWERRSPLLQCKPGSCPCRVSVRVAVAVPSSSCSLRTCRNLTSRTSSWARTPQTERTHMRPPDRTDRSELPGGERDEALVSQLLSNRINSAPEQRNGHRRSYMVLDSYGRRPDFVTGRPPRPGPSPISLQLTSFPAYPSSSRHDRRARLRRGADIDRASCPAGAVRTRPCPRSTDRDGSCPRRASRSA
jgi:hypothetical protein